MTTTAGRTPRPMNDRVHAAITAALREAPGGRRHPCEVTADRLGDHLDRYPDAFDGADRDRVAVIRHVLQDIAERDAEGSSE
jgi:hypothetical protein